MATENEAQVKRITDVLQWGLFNANHPDASLENWAEQILKAIDPPAGPDPSGEATLAEVQERDGIPTERFPAPPEAVPDDAYLTDDRIPAHLGACDSVTCLKCGGSLAKEATEKAWHSRDAEVAALREPCKCDPLYSGEEYCNGGCLLRAEVRAMEREAGETEEIIEALNKERDAVQQLAAKLKDAGQQCVDYFKTLDFIPDCGWAIEAALGETGEGDADGTNTTP